MNTFSKKFVSAALTATTAVWMSGAMMLVPVAHAQTTADLQSQIAALLSQITQLQNQLNGGSSAPSSYTFTRDLTVGSKGDDVKALQQFLNGHGVLVSGSGVGSPGNESTYFGSLTKAALAQWQGMKGISPAVGYFGPKTRAALGTVTTGPITPGSPSPSPVVVPATGFAVSLASDNPATGSLISSSGSAGARIPVLSVNLTAGNSGSVTVTDLNFKKGGVLSDSSISSAYLVENGKVLTQFSSLSNGVIKFSGLGWVIPAGTTKKLTLAVDPATGLSAGNTVSFMIASAADVVAVDSANTAITTAGMFPLYGNIFTVTSVSNPSIASLTISSSSIGTSVYAGTQAVLVSAWTLNGASSPMDLKGINFKVVGSANRSDLRNVKLYLNGTQIGPTLAQVSADGSAYFDLSSAPARINTGSGNLQVYADVMGSPSYNFQFELLNSYDILSVDTQYGVPVGVTINGGAGIQVTILQGSLTVSLDTNTPTGNIAKGGSGTPLGKFKIYAAGEPVKVKFLTFRLDFTGTTTTLSTSIKNITVVDDAGSQVGTTINTPPTSNSCDVAGTGTTAGYNAAGTQYTDCFGTSSSNINYVVPANTTRVLTLRGDIQTGATFSTVVANLVASSNNLQGQTSSQLASSGAVAAGSLTLVANSLTVAQNSAVGTQVYSKGSTGAVIGSYSLLASTAEGANLSSVTILTSASSTNWQSLKLCTGGTASNKCPTQIGITQPTLSASASYTFSGIINIPAGQSKILDVVADVLSGTAANTYPIVTTLSSCSGSGAVTFTSVTCSSTAGQGVVIAGQASVSISLLSGAAPGTQLVMGSTANTLGVFNFVETSNIEDVKLTDINIFQQVATTGTVKSGFQNMQLSGSNSFGTFSATAGSPSLAASSSNPGPGYYYKFSFANPVIIPKSSSIALTLKGDVATYVSSGVTDNTTSVFKIATSTDTDNDTLPETVVALGRTSNASTAITLSSASGNTMTLLRSKLTFSATALGAATSRAKAATDNLATLTFAADSAGDVVINSVTISFSGTAPTGTTLDNVTLIDENGATLGTANTTSSTACSSTTTCTKTFNLGSTTSGQLVQKNTSRSWTLRGDTTKTGVGTSGVSQSMSITLGAITDVRFTDALDSAAATTLSLPSNITVPVNINSVSFASGA